MTSEEIPRPFLPWLGRACRQAREEREVVQVEIAAAIKVNQATIARFEDGTAWPRRPEEVLMAYANELEIDVRLLWLHAFVLWLENEPVLDSDSQKDSGRAQTLAGRQPRRPNKRRKRRKMLRTSRNIPAASGIASSAPARRSRLKSRTV